MEQLDEEICIEKIHIVHNIILKVLTVSIKQAAAGEEQETVLM